MGNFEKEAPVMSIQCDWDDFILSSNKEMWVSCKFRGKDSNHSKLRSQGTSLPICTTGEFSVVSFTKNALYVKHNSSGSICAFIPAIKTYSMHKKQIVSLDVTNGGLGVSVCAENKLLIWDADTGEVRRTLNSHVCDVYKCKFFPSGIVVLSGGADMQLKIWSAETGQNPVTLIGHKAAVHDFCIVDKGRNILSVSKDGSAKLWDCGQSALIATIFKTENTLNCCSIGQLPNTVTVERKESVSDREIGTEDKLLLIGSEEGFVYGVAIYTREIIFTINLESAVNTILHLSNHFMVGCQNGQILIYNFLNPSQPARTFHESNSPVISACSYNQNGFFIGRNDGTVSYYNCNGISNKRIALTGSDCDPIYDIACANNCVYTACRDGKVRKYNVSEVVKEITQQ